MLKITLKNGKEYTALDSTAVYPSGQSEHTESDGDSLARRRHARRYVRRNICRRKCNV